MPSENSRMTVGKVLAEVETYMGPSDVAIIGQAASVILPMASRRMEAFDDRLLFPQLEAALHLTQMRFTSEHVAAMLLNYPVMTGDVTLAEIGDQLGDLVQIVTEMMLNVAVRFDDLLPWLHAFEPKSVTMLRPEEVRVGPDDRKSHWRIHTHSRGPSAFLALAQIPEVAIAKIIERLHLLEAMEQLEFAPSVARAVAQQSLDVHAVVAEMLGVWSVKSRLEDEAFKIVDREAYDAIVRDLDERIDARRSRIQRAIVDLNTLLAEHGIHAEVTGRPKHLYSIFQKVATSGQDVRDVNDSLGVRVIVEASGKADELVGCQQCYEVLSLLFSHWSMVSGVYEDSVGKPYRDWIEHPKANGYQSIHTTLRYDEKPLEVQIRSRAMHDLAEYGAAAHWVYKQDGSSSLSRAQYDRFLSQVAKVRKAYEERQKRMEMQLDPMGG